MGVVLRVCLVLIILQICSAAPTSHTVGDSTGWTIPSSPSFYSSWASKQTFKTGDFLVFDFQNGMHTVAEVTKSAYDSCATVNPITQVNNGPANISISSPGTHYYICTVSGHCSLGQKLAVSASPAPPISTTTPPPPKSATSPAPPKSASAPSPPKSTSAPSSPKSATAPAPSTSATSPSPPTSAISPAPSAAAPTTTPASASPPSSAPSTASTPTASAPGAPVESPTLSPDTSPTSSAGGPSSSSSPTAGGPSSAGGLNAPSTPAPAGGASSTPSSSASVVGAAFVLPLVLLVGAYFSC